MFFLLRTNLNMNLLSKHTKQKIITKSIKSDLAFEAFVNVIKFEIGKLKFFQEKPVLIYGIETIDTFDKSLEIQFLIEDKISCVTISSIDEYNTSFKRNP